MTHRFLIVVVGLTLVGLRAFGDGPADNIPDKVRRIPPVGISLTEPDRGALTDRANALGKELAAFRDGSAKDSKFAARWPDVQVYLSAVMNAVELGQFYKPAEVVAARKLLDTAESRLRDLKAGQIPWATATGPVVRGYASKIDGSVQPYALDVPANFDFGKKSRLDFWFHGRGETLSEVNFITGASKSPGRPTAAGLVLYPYGRYCNANKFAGETDAFEALNDVKKNYPVDNDRIVVRGFSMGGAAAWHFTVHYAGKWCATQPGAGFAETPEFLRVYQDEVMHPNAWEAKLLHWYDCTDWAENVANTTVVAYSGEIDKQKQAADIMQAAIEKEGLKLTYLIGPKTAHAIEPNTKVEIDKLIDAAVAKGRDPLPKKIRFTTYTLRYPQMHWIRLDGLDEHWKRARVEAEMEGRAIRIKTENVSRVTLSFNNGPIPAGEQFDVTIDGTSGLKSLASEGAEKPLMTYFIKDEAGKWAPAKWWKDTQNLYKRRYLTGPIDDAFMDHFVFVEPTGTPMNEAVGKWARAEMKRAIEQWRLHFRGTPIVKKDTEVNDDDLKAGHLILWGDPSSNAVIKRIADKLPIKWSAEGVKVGQKTYPANSTVPVMIYPNPLDNRRYVVINSGFTYREYDYLNNARQIPRLADWAVIDLTVPAGTQHPGGILDGGFFDERWRLK
jgi:hypothetical protein